MNSASTRTGKVTAPAARGRADTLTRSFQLHRRNAYRAAAQSHWARAEELFSALGNDAQVQIDDLLALAKIRIRLSDFDGALKAAQHVLEGEPDHIQAAHVASMSLILQNRWADALILFDRHQDGKAREHYQFVLNHGTALAALGRVHDALPVLLEAMALNLTDPTIHMKVGIVMGGMKMYEESAECFVTAATLDPTKLTARLMALHMRQHACQWRGFDQTCQDVLSMLQDESSSHSLNEGGIFTLTAIDHPPHLLRRAAAQTAMQYPQVKTQLPRRAAANSEGRRLRIGYVSNDFYNHATAVLFVEALEMRDRDRFEVTLYSHSKDDNSPIQHRIRSACERFVDISGLCDADAARQIHVDQIDVLVDLKGHTLDNRMGIFAWRPAPVQATFLGFPGTTGADYIDYVIGDRWVTPLDHAERYTENIAQMPACYQPNDSLKERPQALTKTEVGLPEDKLVLGCFNQAFKITPESFSVWMHILASVPDSVLWILEDNAQATANLKREAEARGLHANRLIFAPRIPIEHHLARIPAADLVLDNWPYNAHTTAGDVLWMGVPIVTLEGDSFASRVAGSLLRNVGLEELICRSTAQYSELVIALLGDRERRQRLKQHLKAGCTSFPLFDGTRFARDLERLYERMVERWQNGLAPAALAAA